MAFTPTNIEKGSLYMSEGYAIATDRESTALDRIENAAMRAGDAADTIQRFIERFHGVGKAGSDPVAPVPSGYLGQIDRLDDQLSRLLKLSAELTQIG